MHHTASRHDCGPMCGAPRRVVAGGSSSSSPSLRKDIPNARPAIASQHAAPANISCLLRSSTRVRSCIPLVKPDADLSCTDVDWSCADVDGYGLPKPPLSTGGARVARHVVECCDGAWHDADSSAAWVCCVDMARTLVDAASPTGRAWVELHVCMCGCVHACVRAFVRACARACVLYVCACALCVRVYALCALCMRACVPACMRMPCAYAW